MFLAYAVYKNFKVYQIDVESSLLNGNLEEVHIKQLDGFQLPEYPNMVCRLTKALYGFKQSRRVQYARLDKHILQLGFKKSTTNSNLYIKLKEIFWIVVYIHDIILGGWGWLLWGFHTLPHCKWGFPPFFSGLVLA